MRKKIVAGNWKMNTTLDAGLQLASETVNMLKDELLKETQVVLCVPFTHLASVKKIIGTTANVYLGAQNCHQSASGAFTGEVSVAMLKSVGVDFVILGHSERREYYFESHELIAKKVDAVLAADLKPIFCCGEKLETRNAGQHFDLVKQQIKESLFHLDAHAISHVVIAYEPVWAIGTGVTASDAQAQEMHAFIRQTLAAQYGKAVADTISILYGGSVKASNAASLFASGDVDGGLVGGASLESRGFVDIVKAMK